MRILFYCKSITKQGPCKKYEYVEMKKGSLAQTLLLTGSYLKILPKRRALRERGLLTLCRTVVWLPELLKPKEVENRKIDLQGYACVRDMGRFTLVGGALFRNSTSDYLVESWEHVFSIVWVGKIHCKSFEKKRALCFLLVETWPTKSPLVSASLTDSIMLLS